MTSMKRNIRSVAALAMLLAGVGAVSGPVPSIRRGQSLQATNEDLSVVFKTLNTVKDLSLAQQLDPVSEGMQGASLGMKGQGFQAGFVGNTPGFGELSFPSPYSVDPMRCPTGMWQVACALDAQVEQQIWYHKEMPKEDTLPMTPEVCFHFCKNVSGVQYMGLQGGDRCYCTPFFHDTNKGSNGACDEMCSGDNSRMCGGKQMADIYQLHDCNNLPAVKCKTPPRPVAHAKLFASRFYKSAGEFVDTPCQNAVEGPLSTYNSLCVIECDFGYELFENKLMCTEQGNPLVYSWAQVTGAATCTPVSCGTVPSVLHTKHPHTPISYPNTAHYTCDIGYTLDSTAHGQKSFEIQCQGTREFTDTSQCVAVVCGTCPTVDENAKFSHSHAIETGDRTYLQSCNYLCDEGYTLNQEAAGPSTHSVSCMATGEFTEPPGCLPVSCGSPPQYANTQMNGPASRDDTVVYSEHVDYSCDTGYTFNQAPSGPTDFQLTCQSNGQYTYHEVCLPVLCGTPADALHATANARPLHFLQTVTYRCDHGYTLTGVAGERAQKTIMCGSDGQMEEDSPVCHPVECGVPPSYTLAAVQSHGTEETITYASSALTYSCNGGYSLDSSDSAWAPYASKMYDISCQADGTFETAPACVDIDDCIYVYCGENSHCENLEPSGVHYDDFTCFCDDGWEVCPISDPFNPGFNTKTCRNINDCPLPLTENCGGINSWGFRRGVCSDLPLHDYDCICGAGYEVGTLPDMSSNKTCVPKVCGNVPEIGHGTRPLTGPVDYDTPEWTMSCDSGYSLDGMYGGATTFQQHCTASAVFSTPSTCLAVTCGPPPLVSHSAMTPASAEMFFPDEETFTCDVGFSTDAKADGVVEFDVVCQADGTQTAPMTCERVECGTIPAHSDASHDTSTVFVYQDTPTITCDVGYSLDHTTNPASTSYNLACLSDGQFDTEQSCKKIECGAPPEVQYSSVTSNSQFYQDTTTYTLDDGYSLDGQPGGRNTFTIECFADSTFDLDDESAQALRFTVHKKSNAQGQAKSGTRSRKKRQNPFGIPMPQPVTCGAAPTREHSTTPVADYVFMERPLYTCSTGHSIDGKASGARTFELKCTEDGSFTGATGCSPIECGTLDAPEHAQQVDGDDGSQLTSLHYGQHAMFECLTGWSHDGILFSPVRFGRIVCQADGTFQYPTVCVNVNDCHSAENACSPNGQCRDIESPTGVHVDDLVCDCDSGFAHKTNSGGSHYCENIPDCPDAACEPGSCQDLVNDYECHCPTGYYQDANPNEDLAHDCLPNLCGNPDEIAHAKTVDKDKDFYFDDAPAAYVCDEGHTLDGWAGGETTFHISCLASKSFQVHVGCQPVRCGPVPYVWNSIHPAGSELVYTETVDYECEEGYSTDQKYHSNLKGVYRGSNGGNTKFSAECQASGQYTAVKECLPNRCEDIPDQKHVYYNYGGMHMEYPWNVEQYCLPGFALRRDKHNEMSYTISCGTDGDLDYTFTDHQGEEQSGAAVRSCRPISCGDLPTPANAKVEGGKRYGTSATAQCNTGYSTTRSCATADASYSFSCQTHGSYGSHPDCRRVQCLPPFHVDHASFTPGTKYYMDTLIYSADDGYTLNAKANGGRSFEITCEADCTYSGRQVFKPVKCGTPPDRSKALHPNIRRTYSQIEPYTCRGGYSVNAQASGAHGFNLECAASGDYDGNTDGCLPVECGNVVVPQNTEYWGDQQSLVFSETAEFSCSLGFSLDGRLTEPLTTSGRRRRRSAKFKTECMADGQQSSHLGCFNKDDCTGNMCGPNGQCVDHDTPTGNHDDDYHCECNSGFEQEIVDGKKTCGNIPDCPEGACDPGTCEDLVNDYKCHCPRGYYEGASAEQNLDHACLPEPCGHPPSVDHATSPSEGTDHFFDSDPVDYTCGTGYSLDGAASGGTTFSVRCQADGSYTQHATCHPVQCGKATHVDNAQFDANTQFVFPEVISYSCNTGYTTDGVAGGVATFNGDCEAGGDIANVLSCEPVACPEVSEQANAQYSAETSLVFPMELAVSCLAGYALHVDQHESTAYTIHCTDAGALSYTDDSGCQAINCGALPSVNLATVAGGQHYEEEATVTCDTGHSIDATADATSAHYTIYCQEDGSYTTTHDCLPISCGVAPAVDYTTNSGSEQDKVYDNVVTYTLTHGYSLDGTTAGQTEFSITCQADSTFTQVGAPLPVTCGAPPSLSHSVVTGTEFWFTERAPYTCTEGYSLDGTAQGGASFHLDCEADGTYSGPTGCEAIQCGAVTAPDHTTQVNDAEGGKLMDLHFPQTAVFECLPGYSKEGTLGSTLVTIIVSCQADGTNLYPATCLNNDDCISYENGCATDGVCVDADAATGIHSDDFHCECDSGFEEVVEADGVKWCSNIPDCPQDACNPGTCSDLVNDYECTCPPGWYEGENSDANLLHDCLPVECGVPEAVSHASTQDTASIFFDSAPVGYTCDIGYTLDGTALGEISFAMTCTDAGVFNDPATCHPVECGVPPSTWAAVAGTGNSLTFEETVTYTCDTGHSLSCSVQDETSFSATCLEDGSFDNVLSCCRVYCTDVVPAQDNANSYNAGWILEYEDEAWVDCLAGYALSSGDLTDISYSITCEADGSLNIPSVSCEPIDCAAANHAGAWPTVPHGTVSGSTLFGESVTVTAHDGYSLDGYASGGKEFFIDCDASGAFLPAQLPVFERVLCDPPLYNYVENMLVVPAASLIQTPPNHKASRAATVHAHVGRHRHHGVITHHALGQSKRTSSSHGFNGTQVQGHKSRHFLNQTKMKRQEAFDYRYGDQMLYECDAGYHAVTTADALPNEAKDFMLHCDADGEVRNAQTMACAPVRCPVHDTPGTDFVIHTGMNCKGSERDLEEITGDSMPDFKGTATQCAQKCRSLAGCVGFQRVNDGLMAGRCYFRAGVLQEPKVYVYDSRDCYERNDIFHNVDLSDTESFSDISSRFELSAETIHFSHSLGLERTFEQQQQYSCIPGFALDGLPGGSTVYTETCQANGEMTADNTCQDVDHCHDNLCGSHGVCHDSLLTYHCVCEEGYEIQYADGVNEQCVQIDECTTQDGTSKCAGGATMGTCVDETSAYHCDCHDGHENVAVGYWELDSCTPITCARAPVIDHGFPTTIPKMIYQDTLQYTCSTGYTTDGAANGHISFTVACDADTTISNIQDCKPVECGATAVVQLSTVDMASLTYLEEATYTCDDGHTVTGTPTGLSSFTVSCGVDGVITDHLQCQPVSCGNPPLVSHARTPSGPLVYGADLVYTCDHGYTTTGQHDGATEFTVTCPESAEISGLETCSAIACGVPGHVSHTEMLAIHYVYPDSFEVSCHSGYTLDATAYGASTYMVSCGLDGEFSTMHPCEPVECGAASSTTAATASSGSYHFGKKAEWTCNEGYTTSGAPNGKTTFKKECQANGDFGTASPSDCEDIDFCHDNPCGANGICYDSGVGITGPGYSCECYEGYEVKESNDGSPTCSADDCQGDPCGVGGTCYDLSQNGQAGMYTCECDLGYSFVSGESPTCDRIQCGNLVELPNLEMTLDNLPVFEVETWLGNEPETSVLFGTPILMSYDQATYTCAEGYSVDGTTHAESKDFLVHCEGTGLFSPPLVEGSEYCVPIVCDNTFIPAISHTEVAGMLNTYTFTEVVEFTCSAGYTLTGEVGGPTSFELTCESDGMFTQEHPICSPVSCSVPEQSNSVASVTGAIHYGQSVTYICDDGFYLGAAVSPSTKVFGGECTAQGTIDLTVSHPECLPANCGAPLAGADAVVMVPGPAFYDFIQVPKMRRPAHHNTKMLAAQKRGGRQNSVRRHRALSRGKTGDEDIYVELADGDTLIYEEIAIVMCESGYTIGGVAGGTDYYEVSCGEDGTFTAGVPTSGNCAAPGFSVSGVVVDAQNGNTKLSDTKLSFVGGGLTHTATSEANGHYHLFLPAGDYVTTATKSGYISREKNISVVGAVQRGQGADIAMSSELPAGSYRILLNWGVSGMDLDAWSYFDEGLRDYVYYGRTSQTGPTSKAHVTLDWDDADGFGPETTTWQVAKDCKEGCLMKFHVDNYSWRDHHLTDADAVVTVYHGNEVLKKYTIPGDIGEARGWTVFTLDASTGEIYEGDFNLGPYIARDSGMVHSSDWSTSMDSAGWSKVPEGSVMVGMGAYSFRRLHKLASATYIEVQNPGAETLLEADWTGILESGGTAMCPEGSWMSGLYRTGSKSESPKGPHQLLKAQCSTYTGIESWGDCTDTPIFSGERGVDAAECRPFADGRETAMVGLTHAGYPGSKKLKGLTHAKCCAFPEAMMRVAESELCVHTQSCVGVPPKLPLP